MTAPRPDVSELTELFYARLPLFMREADELQPDWPLLRFLSVACDPAADALTIPDRLIFDFPEGSSDLGDPQRADAAWLPWLAMTVGVRLVPDQTEQEQRDAIESATTGVAAGTRESIAVAARGALTGTRTVSVRDHEGGDPWTLGITTVTTETASVDAVLAAIEFAQARPAGFRIVYTAYAATWDTVEARYPSWDALEAATTWDNVESTL